MSASGNTGRRAALAFRLTLGCLTAGILLAFLLRGTLLGSPSQEIKGSFFYVWFARVEFWVLVATLPAVLLGAWQWSKGEAGPCPRAISDGRLIGILALGVFAIAAAGHFLVYCRFPLSMDEYNAVFQARLFLAGHIWAGVPESLLPVEPFIRPIFVAYLESKKAWMSFYQPGFSLLYAPGLRAGIPWLLNPLLGAGSVFLAARCAARLFPENPRAPLAAALILAASNQVLFYGMGFYSMQAHLFCNLLWLLLWMRGTPWNHAAAGLVGAFAVHLHQPQVHALFALPFLMSLVLSRRWKLSAWYAAAYGLSALAFVAWLGLKTDGVGKGLAQTAGYFTWWPGHLLVQPVNLVLFLSWNTPALLFFLCFLPASARRHPVLAPLGAGLLLTFMFYLLFPANQGHGWGYRYAHAVLGNACLLGTAGFCACAATAPARSLRLLGLSAAAALALQLPLHAFAAHRFIAPFARADAWLDTLDADLVVLPVRTVWYSQDLMRNDPLERRGPVRAHDLDLPSLERSTPPGWRILHWPADGRTGPGLTPCPPPLP